MNVLYVKESQNSISKIEEQLQNAIKAHKFGVLGIIDLKSKMGDKGVEFENDCKIYEICNPNRAKQVLEQEMSISTVLPCRISIYKEGSKVKVATMLPTATLKLFEVPGLAPVAEEVEKDIKAMVDEAVS